MTACEACWAQATAHAAMFGGVAADHYRRILAENEGHHDSEADS